MVSPEVIQAAFITLLKSKPYLVSNVNNSSPNGPEIREDDWNGTDFLYDGVRVAILNMGPFTNGECRPQFSNVFATVSAHSQGSSSRQCAKLAGLVYKALMGELLIGPGITPVTRINVPDNTGVTMPVPDGEGDGGLRLWRAEVQCTVQIKEAG